MPTTYAIPNGRTVMDATLYTGNASTQTITNTAGFKPDLVWIKVRSIAGQHVLTDSVRGTNYQLFSSLTNAEQTSSTGITSFNSNGFSLGSGVSPTGSTNENTQTYVGWQWQAGQGTTSSNTNGSITSTVSVNPTAGFSIVTFTMPSSGVSTIGHGLGVAPSMVILKSRANSSGWVVYHASTGAGGYTLLNTTAAYGADSNAFNNTAPTSSVFTVGTSFNGLSGTYLAYCWAPVAGFSQFGSYTGNGSADGPFVYLGFRPKFVMTKSASGVESWYINDSSRDTYNPDVKILAPNDSAAEFNNGTAWMDLNSNGFKIRYNSSPFNTSGATYIYAAFAENPFKYANAR